MRVGSTINVAFRALRRNKLRSALTALGIIIGVAAVIAMVGIGNGAKAQVEAQIASLGQNVILIFSGSTTASGIRTGWGGAGTLKIEDADAIRREVPPSAGERNRPGGLRELYTTDRPSGEKHGNVHSPPPLVI